MRGVAKRRAEPVPGRRAGHRPPAGRSARQDSSDPAGSACELVDPDFDAVEIGELLRGLSLAPARESLPW